MSSTTGNDFETPGIGDNPYYFTLKQEQSETGQHVYHHVSADSLRVNAKVIRNSRGYNYEATVVNAKTTSEALFILKELTSELQREFGDYAA